jgi:hypothetical protein
MIAFARAGLEHPLARLDARQMSHECHQEGCRQPLLGVDGQRRGQISIGHQRLWDERVSWNLAHGDQDPGVDLADAGFLTG